jgi:hypothetical protein
MFGEDPALISYYTCEQLFLRVARYIGVSSIGEKKFLWFKSRVVPLPFKRMYSRTSFDPDSTTLRS